jgi:transposase-like protein
MDTSTVTVRADTLGRRVVPRQFRSLEDKLRIIAEARAPGASVAAVSRRHSVNANLVFVWMRQQEQGVLTARTRQPRPTLLAVTVSPAGTTDELRRDAVPRPTPPTAHLEVTLPDGTCVRAFGAVPTERLVRVLRLLRR